MITEDYILNSSEVTQQHFLLKTKSKTEHDRNQSHKTENWTSCNFEPYHRLVKNTLHRVRCEVWSFVVNVLTLHGPQTHYHWFKKVTTSED